MAVRARSIEGHVALLAGAPVSDGRAIITARAMVAVHRRSLAPGVWGEGVEDKRWVGEEHLRAGGGLKRAAEATASIRADEAALRAYVCRSAPTVQTWTVLVQYQLLRPLPSRSSSHCECCLRKLSGAASNCARGAARM